MTIFHLIVSMVGARSTLVILYRNTVLRVVRSENLLEWHPPVSCESLHCYLGNFSLTDFVFQVAASLAPPMTTNTVLARNSVLNLGTTNLYILNRRTGHMRFLEFNGNELQRNAIQEWLEYKISVDLQSSICK